MSKLVVTVGCMFAGKSTALIAQGVKHDLAGHKVLFVKPAIDTRYSQENIVTHEGMRVEAINIAVDGKNHAHWIMLHKADVYLFDEVQFYDMAIVEDIKHLLNKGKTVYVSGLDMDYTGEPFQVTSHLMAIADQVSKLKAVCSDCGKDAGLSARKVPSDDRVLLGSKEIYKPVCRECHKKYI